MTCITYELISFALNLKLAFFIHKNFSWTIYDIMFFILILMLGHAFIDF